MANRVVGPNHDGQLQLAWCIQIEVAGSDLCIGLRFANVSSQAAGEVTLEAGCHSS